MYDSDLGFWVVLSADLTGLREGLPPIDTMIFLLRDNPDKDGNVLVTFTRHRDSKGVCKNLTIHAAAKYIYNLSTWDFKERPNEVGDYFSRNLKPSLKCTHL